MLLSCPCDTETSLGGENEKSQKADVNATVKSLCKDTHYKDRLNVRTAPLVTNHCILTAVVPLSKDN